MRLETAPVQTQGRWNGHETRSAVAVARDLWLGVCGGPRTCGRSNAGNTRELRV